MSRRRSWWKRARRRALVALAAALGPPLLRLLAATWRVRRVGMQHWDEAARAGRPPVFSLWHENIPTGAALFGRSSLTVLISRHHDGEVITRVARRLGFHAARGSTYHGGVAALREMLREAETERGLVVTPDGPRGPRRSVAAGALFLAASARRPLVASGFAASRAWRARSWDRMMIPKPFARVVVALAPGFAVLAGEVRAPDSLEQARARLVQHMEAAQRAAEDALAHWKRRA